MGSPIDRFLTAMTDGAQLRTNAGDLRMEQRQAGILSLSTGRIVAYDAFTFWDTEFFDDAEPFVVSVAPGKYPVAVSVAHRDGDSPRVALAVVRFSSQRPVRWEMAATNGQDPAALEDGKILGYRVDSGFGAIADEATARALSQMIADARWRRAVWQARMGKHPLSLVG